MPWPKFPQGSRLIFLDGPAGSDIYQEMLVKALANHFDAKLLIFDGSAIPEGSFAMYKELLEEWLPVNSRFVSFKPGDGVIYTKSSQNSRGPSYGDRGKVFLTLKEEGSSKIGVRFENPIQGGIDLGGLCEEDRGFFCSASDLELETYIGEEMDNYIVNLFLDALLEVVTSEGTYAPLILFMKHCERPMINSLNFRTALETNLKRFDQADKRKEKVVFIFMVDDNKKEKVIFESLLLKGLSLNFLNKVIVEMPKEAPLLATWKQQMNQDVETLTAKENLLRMQIALSRNKCECHGIDTICIKDQALTDEIAEKVVTWAYRHHLVNNYTTHIGDGNFVISSERWNSKQVTAENSKYISWSSREITKF